MENQNIHKLKIKLKKLLLSSRVECVTLCHNTNMS